MSSVNQFAVRSVRDFVTGKSKPADDPEQEARLREHVTLRIVKNYPDGIPRAAIMDILKDSDLDCSPKTLDGVLERLEHQREIYSMKADRRGSRVWFPNGNLIHDYLRFEREIGPAIYRFSLQEGRRGPRVQIQERSFSLLGGDDVEGAIFFDFDQMDAFVEAMKELKQRHAQVAATGGHAHA